MSTRLDRHYGLFNHMGRSALADGLAQARSRELAELEDELDEIEEDNQALKLRNKKLINRLNQEIDDFNELRLQCIEFMAERDNLAEKLRLANLQIDNLNLRCRQAENTSEAAVREKSNLEEGLEITIQSMNVDKERAESIFVTLMTNKNREDLKKKMALKVALCHIQAYSKFTKNLIAKGIVDQKILDAILKEFIQAQDDEDVKRNGVTYQESVEWLNSQFRPMAKILNVLKK